MTELSLAPLHGMLVHFPIALLFTSAFLELLALHPRFRQSLKPTALATLVLGSLGALATALSGPEEAAEMAGDLRRGHEMAGRLTMILFLLLMAWRLWLLYKQQPLAGKGLVAYLALTLVGVTLLGYTGFLGGKLVYDQAVGVSRAGQPSAAPRAVK